MDEPPPRGERVIAAFDFDKTLSTRDNVVPFVRAVVGRARLIRVLLAISPRLVRAADDLGHHESGEDGQNDDDHHHFKQCEPALHLNLLYSITP